jgi:nucleotide-binding universal stress UspA family protein
MPYRSIWLASDLAEGAEPTWLHALRLAAATSATLTVVHANPRDADHPWSRLTGASERLVQWGLRDATSDAPVELGFDIVCRGIAGKPKEVLPLVMDLESPDLLVLGTHQRAGLERLFSGSVAESLSRDPGPGQVLVIPEGAKDFVDPETGAFSLGRILIPIDDTATQQVAVNAAVQLARTAGESSVEFVLLHRGAAEKMPELELADGPEWWWRTFHEASGGVVPMILDHASDERVSLIVMLTRGHDSLMDAVFGSHTERVLREAKTPVLVVRA